MTDEEEKQERARWYRVSEWNATICVRCGAAIAAGDPVWLVWHGAACRSCGESSTSFAGKWRWHKIGMLSPTPSCDDGAYRAGPCDACGREVHIHERLGRARLFCCRSCHQHYYTAQRKLKRAARRQRDCDVCGNPFQPGKANARTCSSACRQRAYRLRHAVAPPVIAAAEGCTP